MKQYGYFVIIVIVLIFIVIMMLPKNKEYHKSLFYMDTYIDVKIFEKNEKKAIEILSGIEDIYREYHQLTNRYEEYDEIINLYTIYHNKFNDE